MPDRHLLLLEMLWVAAPATALWLLVAHHMGRERSRRAARAGWRAPR